VQVWIKNSQIIFKSMSISEIELTTPLIQSLVREIIYALLIKQPF